MSVTIDSEVLNLLLAAAILQQDAMTNELEGRPHPEALWTCRLQLQTDRKDLGNAIAATAEVLLAAEEVA